MLLHFRYTDLLVLITLYVPLIRHACPKLPKPGQPISDNQKEKFAQWFGTLLFEWDEDGCATVYTWEELSIEKCSAVLIMINVCETSIDS